MSNSIYSSSRMRMTGISSGLDTDTIVKNLLQTEQNKINKNERAKIKLDWYKEISNSLTDKLKNFRNNFLRVSGGSDSMVKSDVYLKFKAEYESNGYVTIGTTSNAVEGSYIINEISKLAKNASSETTEVGADGRISADGKGISDNNQATLGSLNFKNALEFNENGNLSFMLNGKQFTFNQNDTLQSMINTINSDADAGVTVKYSRITDQFEFSAKSGGANSSIEIENLVGNAFGENSAFGIRSGTYENGQDAVFKINGVELTRDSNSFTIDGLSISLKAVTIWEEDSGEVDSVTGRPIMKTVRKDPINIEVTRDIDSTVDSIKKFVDSINELLDEMNTLYNSKAERAYYPLTEDERHEMKEKELELWDEKAKSGLFRYNSQLGSLMSQIRGALYEKVGGTDKILAQVGITTGSYLTGENHKFSVDETMLRAALEENPDEVMQMFMGTGDEPSDNGLMFKISDSIYTYYSEFQYEDIYQVERKIADYESKIEQMYERLAALEEKYYNKFAAMEAAMSQLNSQSDWLTAQLSALTK